MTHETAVETLTESKSAKLYIGSFTGWTALIFTVSTAIFSVWYIFKPEENPNLNLICDLAQMISSTAAFITAWHVSKNKVFDDQTKKAWNILTLAFFSYACGQTLWFYFSSVLGVEPFPSVADIGYTAFYPLMLWALRSFPTAPQTSTDKKKFWLDASTVMVSGLVVVWHFVIRPTIATGDEPLKIGLNLIYVVGDMVLFLGIVTILLKQPKEISRRALYSIIAGLISVAIADIGFAYATLQNISPTGTWFDAFFTFNSYFMIMAGFFQAQSARKYADKEINDLYQAAKINWLPYIAVFIGYIMLLIVSQPYWTEPLGAFIFAAFVITGLVVLRQIVSVKENLQLVFKHSGQKNELKMRSMLENSTDITSVMNESGHFEYLSPAMEKIFGWNTEKLLGTHMYRLVHPDDVPYMLKAYTDNIGQYGKNIALEYRFKHADGTWRDLDGIGQIFRDEETNSNRVLINSRDVTARKADELRLREYTKKLQSSNRELQDFAFVASHDLQEPLRKVQAFGDRLSDKFGDKLGETGLDYLNRMQSASRRMQILITDLLTFSRVTTQAKPFITADLNKIVGEVISDLEVKIEDTNANVTIENLPKFEMDTTQMRQLFQNLIGNGLKFSKPDTSPVINIRCETNYTDNQSFDRIIFDDFTIIDAEIPKGYCRIYVEDNGIGFEEKYLDRIFTVFQRLHGRAAYEGSGIGLAVCRKIVERHNGHLTAKSEPHNGATFIITLPLTQTKNGEINELKTNHTIG